MKEAGEELRKFLCRLMYTKEGREHLQKVAQNLSQLYPDDQDDSGAGVDDEAREGERESALEAQDMRDLENERETVALRKITIRVQEKQRRKDRQKLDYHIYAKKRERILKAVGSRERIPGEGEEDSGWGIDVHEYV